MIELLFKLLLGSSFALFFFFIFHKKQEIIFYVLFFIIVFFQELGKGFSSFNASIFFNQNFLSFANFKIMDLFIFLLFFLSLFNVKNKIFKKSPINLPIKILTLYIIILLGVDYVNHDYFDFGSIRRQLSFVLLYFSLIRLLTLKKILFFNKVLAIMLLTKCFLNLVRFLAGFGIDSIRGKATIFWDSGLIYGLGILCICLFSLIIHKNFILKKRYSIIFFILVSMVLLFAWRRNIWLSLLIGFLLVLQNARLMSKIVGFNSLILIFILLAFSINIFPNAPLAKYVKSMNFFNEDIYYDRSNQVHLENVLGYYSILDDNPQILFFGRRGVLDSDYKNINKWEEYNLGTPHNAIVAKIFNEGIFAVILYIWVHVSFIFYCFKRRSEVQFTYNIYITGVVSFMLAHFILTLFFIPPETTFKGSFFIIFHMLTCISIIESNNNQNKIN